MALRFIQRFSPSSATIRAYPWLRPMARWLDNEQLWRITPHTAATAGAVAVFACFLPMLGQTLVAVALGLFLRANLAILFGALVLGTPIATPPVFYASYRLGAWLLTQPLMEFPDHWDWDWLWNSLSTLWLPLWVGSLAAGLATALAVYAAVHLAWRWRILRRWRRRTASALKRQS